MSNEPITEVFGLGTDRSADGVDPAFVDLPGGVVLEWVVKIMIKHRI